MLGWLPSEKKAVLNLLNMIEEDTRRAEPGYLDWVSEKDNKVLRHLQKALEEEV